MNRDRLHRLPITLSAAAGLWLPLAPASAYVLLDNLGEPPRNIAPIRADFWHAQSFGTAADAARLIRLDLLLGEWTGNPIAAAELRASNAGVPGAVITTLVLPTITPGALQIESLVPTATVTLAPNTTYWLMLGNSGDGSYGWSYAAGNAAAGTGYFDNFAFSTDAGASWVGFGLEDPFHLRIEVSAVPEPGTMALWLAGLAVVGAVARRRDCGARA